MCDVTSTLPWLADSNLIIHKEMGPPPLTGASLLHHASTHARTHAHTPVPSQSIQASTPVIKYLLQRHEAHYIKQRRDGVNTEGSVRAVSCDSGYRRCLFILPSINIHLCGHARFSSRRWSIFNLLDVSSALLLPLPLLHFELLVIHRTREVTCSVVQVCHLIVWCNLLAAVMCSSSVH